MSGPRTITVRVRPYRLAILGGGLVWLVLSTRVLLLATDASDRYVAAVPDDAFYYFQLARNFTTHGFWTFDGTAPTTGFHPLYAYLLVGLHVVAGDLTARTLLVVVGLASAVALGTAAALTGAAVTRLLGQQAVPLAVAVFVTPLALLQTTFLMETWLACLVASCVVFLVTAPTQPSLWSAAGIVLVGTLGSLARTDFVVLPIALVLGHLAATAVASRSPGLRRSLLVLAGAAGGLCLDAVLNLATSGSIVQASVRVKTHWTDVAQTSSVPPLTLVDALRAPLALVTGTLTPYLPAADAQDSSVPYVAALWTLAGVGVLALVLVRVQRGAMRPECLPLVVGCFLAVVGFVLLYSRNSATQLWYAGNLVVPCAVLLASAGRAVLGRRLTIPAVAVVGLFLALDALVITAAPYVNQAALMKTGIALRSRALDGPVGAWNAGIIGFVLAARRLSTSTGSSTTTPCPTS